MTLHQIITTKFLKTHELVALLVYDLEVKRQYKKITGRIIADHAWATRWIHLVKRNDHTAGTDENLRGSLRGVIKRSWDDYKYIEILRTKPKVTYRLTPLGRQVAESIHIPNVIQAAIQQLVLPLPGMSLVPVALPMPAEYRRTKGGLLKVLALLKLAREYAEEGRDRDAMIHMDDLYTAPYTFQRDAKKGGGVITLADADHPYATEVQTYVEWAEERDLHLHAVTDYDASKDKPYFVRVSFRRYEPLTVTLLPTAPAAALPAPPVALPAPNPIPSPLPEVVRTPEEVTALTPLANLVMDALILAKNHKAVVRLRPAADDGLPVVELAFEST